MNTNEPLFPQRDGFSMVASDGQTETSAIRAISTQDHEVIRPRGDAGVPGEGRGVEVKERPLEHTIQEAQRINDAATTSKIAVAASVESGNLVVRSTAYGSAGTFSGDISGPDVAGRAAAIGVGSAVSARRPRVASRGRMLSAGRWGVAWPVA